MRDRLNPKVVVSIVYVAAMFIAAMDVTIVNVALRTIGNEFHVPLSAIGTVNVGYLVSLALFLPMAGWLSDRFGTKRIFLLALGVFTGASALCGLANNLTALNLFRVIQGAGGGLLTPVGMAMLYRTFPPEERVKVSRLLVLPIALAPALGPIVGGFIVEQISWRWVFYINLPFGILALIFGLIYLNEHIEPDAGRIDLSGLLLSAPGFAMVMYALSQGSARGWSSPEILVIGLTGLVLLVVLVFVEMHVSKPMLDLRLWGDRLFRTTGLISMFCGAGLHGMLYVFPLMYQDALRASVLNTGLTTFPEALGLMLATQLVPWFYPRLGPRRLMVMALLLAATTMVLLSRVDQGTNPWLIRSLMFCFGVFLGHVVGSVQIASFANIPSASMGRASTLFIVQNRMGSALGLTLLSSLLTIMGTSTIDAVGTEHSNLFAYRVALLGAATFLLIGLCLALLVRNNDAISTMRKHAPASSTVVQGGDAAKERWVDAEG